jgi:hypothetical protein
MKKIINSIVVVFIILTTTTGQAPAQIINEWKSVRIGGGGYVTGIVAHPLEQDLVYIRTDVGGVFRWNKDEDGWIPLSEKFTLDESKYYSVESIALDPNNTSTVYISAGGEWSFWDNKGAILKSVDKGETWQKTGLQNINVGGNEDWRWAGERLAIDPNNSDVIYFGSRQQGLYATTDGGVTWNNITIPEKGANDVGIVFVLIDGQSELTDGKSSVVYIAVFNKTNGSKIFKSTDGTDTWTDISPENIPLSIQPARGVLSSDQKLFVSYMAGFGAEAGRVIRYDETWTDITPNNNFSYNGIAVDPIDPGKVIVSTYLSGRRIFRTENGGQNWSQINSNRQGDVPWWTADMWNAANSSLIIDPFNHKKVWITDWFGTWFTDNIWATNVVWRTAQKGHEELVVMDLASPPYGEAFLFSGMADVSGFRHTQFDEYPQTVMKLKDNQDISSISFCETNPNYVYLTGSKRWGNYVGNSGFSSDNGKTFTQFKTYPYAGAQNGKIAVSATNPGLSIWITGDPAKRPYRSEDFGDTWQEISGLPTHLVSGGLWTWSAPMESDKVNGDVFYVLEHKEKNTFTPKFHRSTDGGLTWTKTHNFPQTWDQRYRVKAAPGMEGEVWVGILWSGLYRSSNSGETFTKITNIESVFSFGFGAGYDDVPMVYLYGKIGGKTGLFRSDNMGNNWIHINNPDITMGRDPRLIEGDGRIAGRVYVGTGGRSIYYNVGDTAWYNQKIINHITPGLGSRYERMQIAPNPTSGQVHVSFTIDYPQKVVFYIFNSQGVMIETITKIYNQTGNTSEALDLHHLPGGVYIMRIIAGKEKYSKKLIRL